MDDWVGRTLSKVAIERKLGRGGMAEVYLGRHTTLNRPVAVKLLHAHLIEEPELQRRFMAEAQAVASLRHPHIVQIYDYDVLDGRPYMVMELLDGLSLATYLRGLHETGLTLPLGTINKLIDDVASALDYAHSREIIHRDIKPANIMVRQGSQEIDPRVPLLPDVQAILTDFGIARLNTSTTRTETGTVLGTPAYMSPEQIRGVEIDSRSDIYSLGIVLYEMLAGKPPFDVDTTPAAILVKHLQEEPPPMAGVAAPIQQVVDRALAKDPNDRFQQAGQLSNSLAIAVGAKPATDPGAIPTIKPPERRVRPRSANRPVLLWIAGGLAALAALGVCTILAGALLFGDLLQPTRGAATETAPAAAAQATETMAAGVTAEASPTPEPVLAPLSAGSVTIEGNRLSAELRGVQAPGEGEQYYVWLVNPHGDEIILGPARLEGGSLLFDLENASSNGPLLASASAVMFSLQPSVEANPTDLQGALYRAALDPQIPEMVQLLVDVTGQDPAALLLRNGASSQVGHLISHRDLSISSINSGSLPGAKLHAEHVINILEGRGGAEFGDWNGDGRIENPGDDFGLIPYLTLARASLVGMSEAEQLDQATRDRAADVASRLETLLNLAIRARELATRIASADTIEEVRPLGDELGRFQLGEASDAALPGLGGFDLLFVVPVEPVAGE